jgi:hypothetical protein
LGGGRGVERCRWSSCAAGSCHVRRERGGGLLAWPTIAASPQITMEIHISDWTHKFQNKTGLDAKANSEFYKSKRVCSVGYQSNYFRNCFRDENFDLVFCCLKSFAYIMQLISFILSAHADSEKVAAIIPVCDDGWNKFEAHCYFYSGGKELKLSWANAEKDCINRGGHLTSIHSQAEQHFVFGISTIPTWLGASDIISEVCYSPSIYSF